MLVGASLVLLSLTGCAAWRVNQSLQLARESEPFQATPIDATRRWLIVGDSTAVGTGASAPIHSLAGLLSQDFPRLRIDNRARDGATFEGVVQQLQNAESGVYDGVLIQAGGNDVIRFRDWDAVAADIAKSIALALQRSDRVVVMPAGNVGNAPFFFPPVSSIMTGRAERLHALVQTAATAQGAVYVSLFKTRENDPFSNNPALNARDGLHPSDAGYRVWLEELMGQTDMARELDAARAP